MTALMATFSAVMETERWVMNPTSCLASSPAGSSTAATRSAVGDGGRHRGQPVAPPLLEAELDEVHGVGNAVALGRELSRHDGSSSQRFGAVNCIRGPGPRWPHRIRSRA